MFNRTRISALFALPAFFIPVSALAQLVVSDKLTGNTSTFHWQPFGGACLTAGNAQTVTPLASGNSSLPACIGLPFYNGKVQVGGVKGRLPDTPGTGALRLTNGDYQNGGTNGDNQAGAVISTDPFPTNEGVQVTFSTATYGGDGGTGADGITFMLLDGTKGTPPSAGGSGGSLGYSCSNINSFYDGITGGYVGIGIDEYGNFANPGDNTATGPGFRTNFVGIRGAGNVNWAALHAAYPAYYPTNGNYADAVHETCRTGSIQDTTQSGEDNNRFRQTGIAIPDYALIGTPAQIASPIANQQGINMPLRGSANLITYDLRITSDNLLSLSYSYAGGHSTPVITSQSIASTAGNAALPASFLFGFSAGTGGSNNVHEITCFKAAPISASASSAGSNVQQSARVEAGSQVYLSYYHPVNSWGQMTASNLVADSAGNVSISPTANWDASCTLTGGACPATGTTIAAQGPSSRAILSYNGASGVAFQYGSLAAAEANALGGTTDGASRLSFLRGDRTKEKTVTGGGVFRRRDGVLGDIVNSSPQWVGNPSAPYAKPNSDLLFPTNPLPEFGASYASFASANATRANVVYTGANDGMMHGFRSGAFDTAGNFSTAVTPNDGREVIAFMPQVVADSIHPQTATLDYASPSYAHNAYVDATPGVGDLYYNNAWHTWLVGGLGAGGNATGAVADNTSTAVGDVYAVDITNPSGFSEANAAALVIKEWSSATISCTNVATCKSSLGSVYGTPIIRLLHDGNWAVIFGNGRNSSTGTAGIFVMSINRTTGAQTIRFLDTGAASTANKNGIDYVTAADLDGDHVTDYLYAGDMQGNVWRFDLTSNVPGNWAADAAPLFSTPTPGSQPITTRLTVNSILQKTGKQRLVITFGTGRQEPRTLNAAQVYAPGTHAIYGVWDWNLSAWNAKSATQYVALAGPQSFNASNLVQQTVSSSTGGSGSISGYRTISQNPVCWKGTNVCAGTANTQFGYKLILPSVSEQVVFSPVAQYNALFVNTTIPAVTQTLSCDQVPASGYTYAISLDSGGAPSSSLFATAARNAGITSTGIIAAIGLSATGTPSFVTANGKPFLVQQTVSGVGTTTQVDPPGNRLGKRLTWVKLK